MKGKLEKVTLNEAIFEYVDSQAYNPMNALFVVSDGEGVIDAECWC